MSTDIRRVKTDRPVDHSTAYHLRPTAYSSGFTLVEMLVVITIIGVLVALASVAVFKALESAKKARIKAEVTNLESAIQQFRTQYGDYPPSWFGSYEIDSTTVVDVTDARHPVRMFFARAFPRINEPAATWTNLKGQNLSAAQALTFWLHGFSKDSTLPLSGSGGWLASNSGDATPFFDFDKTRFYEATTGAPWSSSSVPIYVPQGGKSSAPYQYFDYHSYLSHAISTSTPTGAIPYLVEPWDVGAAGLTAGNTTTGTNKDDILTDSSKNLITQSYSTFAKLCANPKSFQVVSAGLDNDFGTVNISSVTPPGVKLNGTSYKVYYKSYPTGACYDANGADDDNIVNFSKATSLGDDKQ